MQGGKLSVEGHTQHCLNGIVCPIWRCASSEGGVFHHDVLDASASPCSP